MKLLAAIVGFLLFAGKSHALVIAPIFTIALVKALAVVFGVLSVPTALLLKFLKKLGAGKSILYASFVASMLILIICEGFLLFSLFEPYEVDNSIKRFSQTYCTFFLLTSLPTALLIAVLKRMKQVWNVLFTGSGLASLISLVATAIIYSAEWISYY